MQDIIVFSHRHWLLVLAFVVVIISVTIIEFIKQKKAVNRLSPGQATQLINHENAVVVDIRNTEAFNNGHIIDSISLPLADLNLKIKKLEKNRSNPLIIVCAQGTEANKACDILVQQGFRTYILEGGIRSWRDAEMPLVKG